MCEKIGVTFDCEGKDSLDIVCTSTIEAGEVSRDPALVAHACLITAWMVTGSLQLLRTQQQWGELGERFKPQWCHPSALMCVSTNTPPRYQSADGVRIYRFAQFP
jgi:hypothetical protein